MNGFRRGEKRLRRRLLLLLLLEGLFPCALSLIGEIFASIGTLCISSDFVGCTFGR